MCGRYVRRGDKQKIAEYFQANPQPAELLMPHVDYNVAPTTFQPIIRQSKEAGNREMVLARWGLVPFFTKDLKDIKGPPTINARAESITKAATWREPMKKRRCIIPANAFYEWEKAGKPPKQPYAFELANGKPLGFAGLWDAWKDKDGHWLQSFAIVTTEANELMAALHPRMPVILHQRDYDRWLDREETERLGCRLAVGTAVLRRVCACGLSWPRGGLPGDPLDLTNFLIENKAATFLMRVYGDSMRDAGILDGDLLVVDRCAPESGCVVVVAVNGEHTVKRLRRGPDCVWLGPANPLYQSIRVSVGEDLHVFGVVRHAIHTLR